MDDVSELIALLRRRARMMHGGASNTSTLLIKAADALEIARVVDEEREHFTKLALAHERALRAIVSTVSIAKAHEIAGDALCRILPPNADGTPVAFAGSHAGRYVCPTCDGGGEVAADCECPDCDGTGYVVPALNPFRKEERG